MGAVEKTTLLEPEDKTTSWDVDHKLDREFKNSD